MTPVGTSRFRSRALKALRFPLAVPPEEIHSPFEGQQAYYGTYDVSEATQTITLRIEYSLLPDWTGDVQERGFEFADEGLVLSTELSPPVDEENAGTFLYQQWERAV